MTTYEEIRGALTTVKSVLDQGVGVLKPAVDALPATISPIEEFLGDLARVLDSLKLVVTSLDPATEIRGELLLLVDDVAANVAVAERAVGTYESALAAILGRSPRAVFDPQIARDATRVRLLGVPEVASGLPSDLLERRPDVRQVEAQLADASLRIDAARAQYFPSLALTASYGSESAALANLFSTAGLAWGIGASLLQPLVGLQAIEASVEAESARREAAVVSYVQTVQTAFRETHDALLANRTTREALAAQAERARKLEVSLELAELRYRSGYSAYIDVLDAQRQLLQAQTLQILAARDVRFALIDLAKAMGGGWDYKAEMAAQ